MKQTILAAVLMAAFGVASATGTGPVVGGSAGSVSGSAAYAASSGNGASFSGASNKTWSSVTVGGSQGTDFDKTYGRSCVSTGYVSQGGASVDGKVSTGSISTAGNLSFGNATGGAAAGGLSNANAFGAAGYLGVGIGGGVTGFATSTTGNAVVAGRNEFGFVAAKNVAGFSADADSKQTYKAPFSFNNEASTNVSTYSISNEFGFGNVDIYNVNGGVAGAAAGSFAGNKTSSK